MKLLIVDDSLITRRMIERHLEPSLFSSIETAPNGLLAVQKFKDNPTEVVTMDITMPEMDGLSCVDALLKIKRDTKILVVSALADKSTAVEAIKRGAEGFLLKPFTPEDLQAAFSDLIED